jgi:hypothetical protein
MLYDTVMYKEEGLGKVSAEWNKIGSIICFDTSKMPTFYPCVPYTPAQQHVT